MRDRIAEWARYAALEFAACFDARTPRARYAELDMPLLIMKGEHTRLSTRTVVSCLASQFQYGRQVTVAGAGHMGPLTHAKTVAGSIASFVLDVAGRKRQAMCRAAT